ncbi:unnamed protein product [Mytilus edulis]|uniref:Uncharacterized protein n=1 Tax=Mytilus edulis TaxID=6550 RepID=A0A8S3PXQ7_MYTED|nr:unnamed protein product [Mytilus edulis]
MIGDKTSRNTPDIYNYYTSVSNYHIYPAQTQSMKFSVKTCHHANLLLSAAVDLQSSDLYEISIGDLANNRTKLHRKDKNGSMFTIHTPRIVSCTAQITFVISWKSNGNILLIKETQNGTEIIFDWTDPSPLVIKGVGIATAWGSEGLWIIQHTVLELEELGHSLALDALYEHGKTTGFVNIMEYTHMMRQDRMNMIQTVEQYATVYDVLVEAFTVPQYAIPRQDFLNMLDSRLIEREYQKLQDLKPVTEANKFQAGKRKENVPKNAVQNILPHDDYRPYLMSYGRSSNDYINAVKIPSFTEGSNIFVTQYPLLNTIGDFWSLVYDNNCRTIVILEEINEDVPVIPSDTDHKISNDNFIISRNSQNVSLQDGVKVSLRHKNKKEERPITVFVYNDWEDNNPIPNSTKTMVDFLEIVSTTTRADHESIVVICRDGCTRSGIFVTLKLVLEKMETDDEVDIFQVSRRIQTRRPQFLSSITVGEFLQKGFSLEAFLPCARRFQESSIGKQFLKRTAKDVLRNYHFGAHCLIQSYYSIP